ncbi:hypothetical protein LL946_00850 [Knoellia locipacati]|uniref:hypothetical protein n=1 Tax=Knoellia locipacati TaxID=882824 RepID=UPI00384E6986
MKDKHVVKVTRDQVQSARALIDFAGGEDKVDPVIVKIAHALRRSTPQTRAS